MFEGVVAIIGVFFVPAAMVILIVWFRNSAKTKRYKLQTELYAKALEKGQPIPADLFAESKVQKKKRNPLNTGIICISVGIGVAMFIWLSKGAVPGGAEIGRAASIGIIPFLIGVAYVIIHFIEKQNRNDESAQ